MSKFQVNLPSLEVVAGLLANAKLHKGLGLVKKETHTKKITSVIKKEFSVLLNKNDHFSPAQNII